LDELPPSKCANAWEKETKKELEATKKFVVSIAEQIERQIERYRLEKSKEPAAS
jgi:hypothetical protein